jgi:hypothetical protein
MSRTGLIPIVATLAAATTWAAEPPPPPPKLEQICRGSASSLGSRIRRPRRCQTAGQWRAEDELNSRLPATSRITEGQHNNGTQRPHP